MLSAASASPVSSYAAIPITATRVNDASAPPVHVPIQVSNRCALPGSQRHPASARASWRATVDDAGTFGKHLRNVDKAATSARASLASTARSRADILSSLDDARTTLDAALRDFAPGFPDRCDVPLASDRSQRAIPPLLDAIKNYETQLRRLESMQTRRCKPLSTCVAAVALSIALGGSAIALCMPPVRATPGEDDLINPGVRLCAALLAYVPLLSIGLHYVLSGKASTIDLREALSALRCELNAYVVANATSNASVVRMPTDVLLDAVVAVPPQATQASRVRQPTAAAENKGPNVETTATKCAPALVHDETITSEMPFNGSDFLA